MAAVVIPPRLELLPPFFNKIGPEQPMADVRSTSALRGRSGLVMLI